MYQENELKKLYERLKAQYPQYQLEFSGDSLTLNRLYCKVEVNQSGVKIYVNGNLYDQFTSEYVDDLDDLYELIETSVYKGYKQDKIEMRGDRAEMSDFPLYLNTVAGGLDRRDQTIGGFSFVVKIYALPVVEIIG